jgi:Leucine-rich repeat (LRR) protein
LPEARRSINHHSPVVLFPALPAAEATGMAPRSVSLLLLLTLVVAAVGAGADDEAALIAFKAAAIFGGDTLASWNSSGAGGFCGWVGVTCGGGAKHRRVVALNLPLHGLSGSLSPAVGNLSFLRTLNLSSNALSGGIPDSLGRLRLLRELDLSSNAFSGEIPANLSSCTSLVLMRLRFNQLTGSVPYELGEKLMNLVVLSVWNNSLTGTIPASLANLSSLSILSLGFNQLHGTIPPGIGAIQALQHLDLNDNHLSGEPPHSLYNLTSLERFQLNDNMLHGRIPDAIGIRFHSMQMLEFYANQFTGSIPVSLFNLTTLQMLDLSENRLGGYVSGAVGRLVALQSLLLYGNLLQADDKEGWEFITSLSNCTQLVEFEIGLNAGLTGQLPSSIANLSSLQTLRFDGSGISGSIPSAIGNLLNLQVLGMSSTFISGVIPESIGRLGNLTEMDLFSTDLSGIIPLSIGNLKGLNVFDAHHCNLGGPIPASIGNMSNLLTLDLSKNSLDGSISNEIFKLSSLIYLNLSYNSLSGHLPSEMSSLGNLNQLVLSGNRLSGEIPESIGECTVLQYLILDNNSIDGSIPQTLSNIKGLTALNLSMNKLTGVIPSNIGTIQDLQVLYLAHNNLSGPIPSLLQNLTALSELDLSFNNLQGEVPKEGIFRYSTNFSIIGNSELCGGLPQLHLAPCQTDPMKKNRKGKLKHLKIALATIGALLILAFFIALLQFIKKKLIRNRNQPLPPIVEEQQGRVSYHVLANGTNGFSEANLLGKGSFGAVYKCTLQPEETVTAVKVFNLQQSGSTKSFVAECEALRMVRHRCLIKIITCCSSMNHQGQEFKALVFEFMPNGSLEGWLHPNSDILTMTNTLSLEQRLDIAVDIMDALNYLHNHCQPPIAHCDLKPSNILLAEDMSARVGDFGISRILPENASKILQNSNSTIGIRGSVGYVAPGN